MLSISELQHLNALATQYKALNQQIKISPYNTPLNRSDEKNKLFAAFRSGGEYNPQFVYKEVPFAWHVMYEQFLSQLNPDKNIWEHKLAEDVRATLETLETLRTHDPALITASTIRQHGLPTLDLVTSAQELLTSLPTHHEERTISSQMAAEFMERALSQANLHDWKVEISSSMNAGMMVRGSHKQLLIRDDRMFSERELNRLLVHEIGTHIFRKANGQIQPLRLLSIGLTGYLTTEEGLAAYHEHKFGLSDTTTMRRYALRVLAAHLSLTHTYHEVFSEIVAFTDFEDAFNIVTRAKRGFVNTSEYGSHVKDKIYLEGFILIQKHLAHHPEDYQVLMSGKVSIALIPQIQKLRESEQFRDPVLFPDLLVSL